MVLSMMRPKEVRKGSGIPAKGRIDVFIRVGMQNSSSSFAQRGSNCRCQKDACHGRVMASLIMVRSLTAVPPQMPEKGMKATQYRELQVQILTITSSHALLKVLQPHQAALAAISQIVEKVISIPLELFVTKIACAGERALHFVQTPPGGVSKRNVGS